MSKLDDLLQTRSKRQQVERVEQLMMAVKNLTQAPVIDVTIRYDGRSDEVNVDLRGGFPGFPALMQILERARQQVIQAEIQAGKEVGANGAKDAAPEELEQQPDIT
jgi:hypothetical protein